MAPWTPEYKCQWLERESGGGKCKAYGTDVASWTLADKASVDTAFTGM